MWITFFLNIVFFQLIFCICQLLLQNRNTMEEYKTHIVRMNGILHRGKMVCVYQVCQFPFIGFDKEKTDSFVATKILY